MNKFVNRFELFVVCKLLFDEVFNGFYIVVGCRFDVFDALSIGFAEVGNDGVKLSIGVCRERWNFGDGLVLGKTLQPAYLNFNTGTDKTEFRENSAQ